MELSVIDGFIHRGEQNLIRLLPGCKLRDVLTDAPFQNDPDDNNVPCLPAHYVEYLYGRTVTPDAMVERDGITLGSHALGVALLARVETQLVAAGLFFAKTSTTFFVRRLDVLASSGTHVAAASADFVTLQPLAAPADDTWLADVPTARLVSSSGRLSVYADTVGMLGARTLGQPRAVSANSRFASTLRRLATAACAADGIVLPRVRPAVAGIPAVAVVPAKPAVKPPRGDGGTAGGEGAVRS